MAVAESPKSNDGPKLSFLNFKENPALATYQAAGLIVTPALVYHGYKRNHSVLWALAWLFVPNVIGLPLALAQGFGKPKGR